VLTTYHDVYRRNPEETELIDMVSWELAEEDSRATAKQFPGERVRAHRLESRTEIGEIMGNQAENTRRERKKPFLSIVAVIVLAAMLLTFTAPLRVQSQSVNVQGQRFDVASIKQNKPTESRTQFSITRMEAGGRFVAIATQLRTLIAAAYQLKPDQARLISGMPDWANSEGFDIEAKAEGNPTREQTSLMLQWLLADRFKLVMHRETRQVPIYALVSLRAGRTGPQLHPHSDATECLKIDPSRPVPTFDFGVIPPPPPPCGRFISGTHRLAGNNVTMEMLATNLGAISSVGHPVVNRIELSGNFDLSLDYSSQVGQSGSQLGPDASASDPSAPSAHQKALVERDQAKLLKLVYATEEALFLRWQELHLSHEHEQELHKMALVCEDLLRIKTDELGWPLWEAANKGVLRVGPKTEGMRE